MARYTAAFVTAFAAVFWMTPLAAFIFGLLAGSVVAITEWIETQTGGDR